MKSSCVSMYGLHVLLTILSVAEAVGQHPTTAIWNLFKLLHDKQYIHANEEHYR
jgi:hypothetical protein